ALENQGACPTIPDPIDPYSIPSNGLNLQPVVAVPNNVVFESSSASTQISGFKCRITLDGRSSS
ncbi:MAG: hypothetical protein JSV68_11110, partial [Anaerolineaceae bacterium]